MNVTVFAGVHGERGRGYRTRGYYHLKPISSIASFHPSPTLCYPVPLSAPSFRRRYFASMVRCVESQTAAIFAGLNILSPAAASGYGLEKKLQPLSQLHGKALGD